MNRIYKVIWSKVKHQYVVVSEFAHSCTKSTGSRVGRSTTAVLAAFVLTMGVGSVQANYTAGGGWIGSGRDNSISIGDGSNTYDALVHADNAIAIGHNSFIGADANGSIAIGFGAQVASNTQQGGTDAATDSIAIGYNAKVAAEANNSVAFGANSKATEADTFSIGSEGNERKLVNMKDGEASTDGATVGQMEKADNALKAKNGEQDSRLNGVESKNNEQDSRLNGVESKNNEQDSRLNVVETNIGDLNYGSNNYVNDEDDLTTSVGNLDRAVGNLDNRVDALDHRVDNLDSRIDKVGAGAAALAALHPLDFDPDAKWDFAAGYGNYNGENAVAVGTFYRPNEDTMFSVGGTFGNGENMINAGVSLKIGAGSSHVTTSRVAMAKEIKSMRDIVAKQDAQIQKLTAMVNALVGVQTETDTTTMFPDVPENHWAYEAVAAMAKSGLVKGYPDGEFKGDRNMTRYEFAQIVYNAIQAGAEVDARLVEEFKPELEYFHIATVAKDKDGNPTIERVRAN